MFNKLAIVPILSAVLVCGCVFNSDGVSLTDASPDSVAIDQATADLPVDDMGSDTSPDTTPWDPECKKDLSSGGNVCRPDSKYGQSGSCTGGKFTRIRYCFKDAPCDPSSGMCKPSGGCSACPGAGNTCTTTCTSFVTYTKTLQSCCVGTSDNGSGGIGSACAAHTDCKTGLCLDKGKCFFPCSSMPVDSCPTGYWCAPVKITLGAASFNTSGCSAKTADSGVDSAPKPDSVQPDSKLPIPDQTLPDQASPDQASPDAASPDAASPDAALPDVALPDQGQSVDSSSVADTVPGVE